MAEEKSKILSCEVVRDAVQESDKQTLGKLILKENNLIIFTCETLELPDLKNQRQISCIPKGAYKCVFAYNTSAIPYHHIAITGVPNRDGVCIHSGNYYTQIRGCVIVGSARADINADGIKDVTNSMKTFMKFMALVGQREFPLTIK